MKSAALRIVLAALSLGAARGLAESRDVAGEFVGAEGLEVTLWAESPLFFEPTNIDVDQRGRLWLAEGVNYRTFRGRDANQPDVVPFRHPEGDRIVILDSILNPSAVIAAGYEPWLIETKDGETYSGFVVSEGDTVTLKEPTGHMRPILAKHIASRQQQKRSLMPGNISLGLTPQELVDLVEFLMSESVCKPLCARP